MVGDGRDRPEKPAGKGPDGGIARVAADTVPMSETPVAVTEPMTAVLEIRSVRAARLGIGEGEPCHLE